MKKSIFMMVMLLGICVTSIVSADTVLVYYDRVEDPVPVNIGLPGGTTTNTSAGSYVIEYPYLTGTQEYRVYCVEPQTISSGVTAAYTLVSIADGSGYEAAAWVLSQGYTGTMAAAAQVAVWELTWDYQVGNSFSLIANNFRLNSPDPYTSTLATDATAIYNSALTAIADGFDQSGYRLATNGTYQDFVVPNPVPIPAAVWLLGTGLIGLVGIRRRMVK